jgi:hypothetical protein
LEPIDYHIHGDPRCHLFGATELFRQQATRLQVPVVHCLKAQKVINRIDLIGKVSLTLN